eukprot:gnl/Hemi2/940_TR332_c0_g1_i1.p2 gnl/Hemi2/940_TR332_c0_g1~~gnl/Hemi2/940_TR332_c0_g1_i1.p2  ORF type:complete len:226 (-),score=62.21 gnl/Hemi2/940_TR332_c0_g1_i1:167-844(-)
MVVVLPPLPAIPLVQPQDRLAFRGPHSRANWVVPGRVLAGCFPGIVSGEPEAIGRGRLADILLQGVNVFVCVQSEAPFCNVPYKADVEALWPVYGRPFDAETGLHRELAFRQHSVADGTVFSTDTEVEALVQDLIQCIHNGDVLYVHCWGGHGRTGIVVSCLLAALYDLSAEAAMTRVQMYHDCREDRFGGMLTSPHSPATPQQRAQVERVVARVLPTQCKCSLM